MGPHLWHPPKRMRGLEQQYQESVCWYRKPDPAPGAWLRRSLGDDGPGGDRVQPGQDQFLPRPRGGEHTYQEPGLDPA